MDIYIILLVIFLSTLFQCQDKVDGSRWSLSKEEDFEIERQLKLLNKPATKTIQTKFGDIYDCIDFYDQPAFDHPLLKNETFHFEVESASSHSMKNDQFFSESVPNFGFQGEACPVGTVPIRRITKQDLIREKNAQTDEILNTGFDDIYRQVALAQTTNETHKYSGAGGILSIHNPNATGPQYSESRILIQSDNDVIQVGWRVDPFLYGDSMTHLFISTNTGHSRCFGVRCSAFILTNRWIPIDGVFNDISVVGGKTYDIQLDIIMDSSGNWRLRMGSYDRTEIGFWPQKIFNDMGLKLLANHIEYGGEVYSPPRVPKPPMGNGLFPNPYKLGPPFIRQATYRIEQGGPKVNAEDATAYADDNQYLVIDIPHTREASADYWGHVVLYGGPGGKPI